MKYTGSTKIIIILGLIILSQKGYSQETLTDAKQPGDTLLIREIKFLQYQVETLYQIVSIQSGSITNINLMLQIINEENKRLRNEIDSLQRNLEVLDIKRIKRKTDRKQKIEPLKL